MQANDATSSLQFRIWVFRILTYFCLCRCASTHARYRVGGVLKVPSALSTPPPQTSPRSSKEQLQKDRGPSRAVNAARVKVNNQNWILPCTHTP